jgi:hypothetical protein
VHGIGTLGASNESQAHTPTISTSDPRRTIQWHLSRLDGKGGSIRGVFRHVHARSTIRNGRQNFVFSLLRLHCRLCGSRWLSLRCAYRRHIIPCLFSTRTRRRSRASFKYIRHARLSLQATGPYRPPSRTYRTDIARTRRSAHWAIWDDYPRKRKSTLCVRSDISFSRRKYRWRGNRIILFAPEFLRISPLRRRQSSPRRGAFALRKIDP